MIVAGFEFTSTTSIALFAQRLAGLHAGIIKLAALPDHDRAGADEQDFLELVVPRHLRSGNDR